MPRSTVPPIKRPWSFSVLSQRALRSPLGAVVAAPWIDPPVLWGLARIYFPLSRLWASARSADGSVERFFAEIPLASPSRWLRGYARWALRWFERARAAAQAAEVAWEDAFFGPGGASPMALRRLERRRVETAHRFMLTRFLFLGLLLARRIPAVRLRIPDPKVVGRAYGAAPEDAVRAMGPPATWPEIETSRRMPVPEGEDYWLRFPTPSARLDGYAWARVHEPMGRPDAPTLIFGSGVGIDVDQWDYPLGEVGELVAAGLRVIEIEAPWHGRRVAPGDYGGEAFFATAPLGPMDLFAAQAREILVLVDWARRQGAPRVAAAGVSMGALATLIAAAQAQHWPAEARPDALCVVTFCGEFERAALESSLMGSLGVSRAMAAAGWTAAELARWRALSDVDATRTVPPERIVALLGSRDTVTPYALAADMVAGWGLPPENLFIRRQGHFSAAVGLRHDPRPLERIRDILLGGQQA